jgi:hypothetical protein
VTNGRIVPDVNLTGYPENGQIVSQDWKELNRGKMRRKWNGMEEERSGGVGNLVAGPHSAIKNNDPPKG